MKALTAIVAFLLPIVAGSAPATAQGLKPIDDRLMVRCLGTDGATNRQSVEACTALINAGRAAPSDESAYLYYSRAVAYWDMDQFERALEDIDRAIEQRPDGRIYLYARAHWHGDLGHDDLAIRGFGEVIRVDPKDSKAYSHRGLLYLKTGAVDRALQDLDRVVLLTGQSSAEAFNHRGIASLKIGRPDAALADFARALKLKPKDLPSAAMALFGRGVALGMKGDTVHGDADRAAGRALQRDVDGIFVTYGISGF